VLTVAGSLRLAGVLPPLPAAAFLAGSGLLLIVRRVWPVATLAGVVIGLPLAYLAARALRTLMFGITESDPLTYAATALFFVALALAAAVIPARRAARVDPVIALRAE